MEMFQLQPRTKAYEAVNKGLIPNLLKTTVNKHFSLSKIISTENFKQINQEFFYRFQGVLYSFKFNSKFHTNLT